MSTVLAQGTFDILHPGHVHYLENAASVGDELYVVVARRQSVTHKPAPIVSDEQRRDLVASLEPVDRAVLGHPDDIFAPLEEIRPDVVVLGHDQHHDEASLERALERRGFDCEVRRVSAYEPSYDRATLSSSDILERAIDERERHARARMRPPTIRNELF
jgi:FAD synthetase